NRRGAGPSVEVSVVDAINSIDDTANPGVVPAGPQAAGLLISEIMYNPRSPEPGWEWIEVVNNTGQTIDFANNGYFLYDIAGGALANPNITSGSIEDGGVAILYDDSVDPADFTTAWGAVNAIPVSSFSALNNGGDTVALWSNSTDYSTDRTNGDFANADVSVPYDDDGVVWPFDDGMASIYLTDLSADASVGTNWLISFNGDGISFNASAVGGMVIEHVGGDIGSPGFVPDGSNIIDADFNDDMVIDGADIDLLTMDVANGTNDVAMFDLNGDGSVTYDDVVQWLADAGAANLPSMNSYLLGDANLDGTVDGQDFVIWNGQKFTTTGKWTEGDFNADGNTDGQDFIAWNSFKFTSADNLVVPEPRTWGVAVLILCGWLIRRR
ncbi:MAG: lamin tail domain-containing protein, partial [Planctomycetota bacterium]